MEENSTWQKDRFTRLEITAMPIDPIQRVAAHCLLLTDELKVQECDATAADIRVEARHIISLSAYHQISLSIFYLLLQPFLHLFRVFDLVNCTFILYDPPDLYDRCYSEDATDDPVEQALLCIQRIHH